MSGSRQGKRQLATLSGQLSERDRAIVRSVSQLRLATAGQLERLHFLVPEQHATPLTAARTARRTLERLVRQRLLVRLARRIGGVRAGSASYIYAVGPVGQRVLAEDGPRRRFREPSALFVGHTLAVSELYVDLHQAVRAGRLAALGPIQAEPSCWRRLVTAGGRVLLKPDLFAVTGDEQFEYRWFVEVDLATEHTPAIVRKCQTYEAYYQGGAEQAAHGVFPRVLWVAPDDDRAARIGRAIGRATELTDGLFTVATVEQAVMVLAGGQP